MVCARAQQRDGAGQVLLPHAVLQALQRDLALRGEARKHGARALGVPEAAVAAQAGDALLVARRHAGNEPRAEHLLHLGEAAIAHGAREADDGGGLHTRALRHLGHRAERHVGRVVERELGDLLQAVGKTRMTPGDLGAQRLVGFVLGRAVPDRHVAFCIPLRSAECD